MLELEWPSLKAQPATYERAYEARLDYTTIPLFGEAKSEPMSGF
jgi:hypothetical protein